MTGDWDLIEPCPVIVPQPWFDELAEARIVEDPSFTLPWNES